MAEQHHTIAAGAAQNSKVDKIKIITDEPTFEDALDFGNYSMKLAEIIKNSTPRFSIGIFGGWGTGKTSLMWMTKRILDSDEKVVTVWFDAWRYEREEYLAVIPFLRTVKLTLDAAQKSKAGNWEIVKNGVVKTGNVFSAIAKSAKISSGIPGVVSADIDFGKASDVLKGDGSIADDKNTIYYYVTGFLEKALYELRKQDADYRIVIFIDDLDRCDPAKALEVLESIKSFFDIEGIIYVIGMDSETINSLIKKKYGEEYAIKGLDYLQKIVQLPFQIPTWKEVDISNSISKLISKGLEGSVLVEEFEKYKELTVRAIKLNPREVKRFINNIILAKSVFDKPIDELIAVRALDFRRDWNKFFELITPDNNRENFFNAYKQIKKEGRSINNNEELSQYIKEITDKGNTQSTAIFEIYQELIKQGKDLTNFLDAGADGILLRMKKMEEYRRALAATKIRPTEESIGLKQGRKALVIGNSDYDNLPKLSFCKNDGEDMSQLLQSLGYQITENSRLVGSNDFISMREAIHDFFSGPKARQDTLIFYYSGHATVDYGEVYLAASDMNPEHPSHKGISLDEIVELMQAAIPIRVITILDCVYSGSARLGKQQEMMEAEVAMTDRTTQMEEQAMEAKNGIVATAERVRKLHQGEGKCILASSQGINEASTLKEGGHSIFTHFLLEGLKGNPQSIDTNGNITPKSLAKYLYDSLLNMPPNMRPSQKPMLKVEGSGDIILASYPHLISSVQ